MLRIKRIAFFILVSAYGNFPEQVLAGCGIPKMSQVTTGKFKVVSFSPMSVTCVDRDTASGIASLDGSAVKNFTAPGCLLKVTRLTPPETGFNNDKTYDVYYDKSNCPLQIGRQLYLELNSQCCSEFPVKCDQDPSKNKTQSAATAGQMACADPGAGHWKILPSGAQSKNFLDIVRKKAKESESRKK